MASQTYTDGVTLSSATEWNKWDSAAYAVLSGVAGTNTVTATGAANYTLVATNVPVWFIPANTNTGATTLNITPSGGVALGAKNVFFDGRACVGGEIVQNVPCGVIYDGTQYNIVTPAYIDRLTDDTSPDLGADYVMTYDASTTSMKKVLLGRIGAGVRATEQASTSGTTITFTGIPAWATEITFHFVGVSTSGTNTYLVQLGDSGGLENSGYNCTSSTSGGDTAFTTGFGIPSGSASNVWYGHLTFKLEDASDFTWSCSGNVMTSLGPAGSFISGTKATSAAVDRIGITTTGGADTFDLGAVNVTYK